MRQPWRCVLYGASTAACLALAAYHALRREAGPAAGVTLIGLGQAVRLAMALRGRT